MKWSNCVYAYVPSLLDLPATPPHPTALGRHRTPNWAPGAIQERAPPSVSPVVVHTC